MALATRSDQTPDADGSQLRLFVEEICCDLIRLRHAREGEVRPEDVRITRAADLGGAGRYADVRVEPPAESAYYLEVSYGRPTDLLAERILTNYGDDGRIGQLQRVVVVADVEAKFLEPLQRRLGDRIELELWNDQRLCVLIRTHLGVEIDSLHGVDPHELRAALDEAKWRYACADEDASDSLRSTLLWHFGFWRLRRLRETEKREPTAIIPPGEYPQVVVLTADLCSFSSYVRDTPSHEIVRDCMTTFYSRTHHQVHDLGGMLLEFVGDSAVGLFGVPDRLPDSAERALHCAHTLASVGRSVCEEWQSRIDRLQPSGGVSMGISVGDLRVISQRAFSRSRIGIVGEAINLAARLSGVCPPSHVVVSNSLYAELPAELRATFTDLGALEAKNMGKIKAWRAPPAHPRE